MSDKTFLSTLSKLIQPFPENTVQEQNSQQNWNYNSGTCAFRLKSKVFTKTPNTSFCRFYLKYCLNKFLFWYIKVVWRKSQRVPTELKKRKKFIQSLQLLSHQNLAEPILLSFLLYTPSTPAANSNLFIDSWSTTKQALLKF